MNGGNVRNGVFGKGQNQIAVKRHALPVSTAQKTPFAKTFNAMRGGNKTEAGHFIVPVVYPHQGLEIFKGNKGIYGTVSSRHALKIRQAQKA
jgi:hypothetical protein